MKEGGCDWGVVYGASAIYVVLCLPQEAGRRGCLDRSSQFAGKNRGLVKDALAILCRERYKSSLHAGIFVSACLER